MKDKNNKRGRKEMDKRLLLFGIILILLYGFIFLVSALTDNERTNLQSELDNLTSSLSSQGYGWLVDYNLKNGGKL